MDNSGWLWERGQKRMRTFQDSVATCKGTGGQQQVSSRAETRISAFCGIGTVRVLSHSILPVFLKG